MTTTIASPTQSPVEVLAEVRRELEELSQSKSALQNKRAQIAGNLVSHGKLTAEQKRELAKTNKELADVERKLKPIGRRHDRAYKRVEAQRDREAAKQATAQKKTHDRAIVKRDRLVARAEAASLKKACFITLPERCKPALSTAKDHVSLKYGKVTQQGKGKKARWVLVVTDTYSMVVLPLQVSHPSAIREAYLPPEALAAIQKTGAFRITRAGAVQALKVSRQFGFSKSIPVDGLAPHEAGHVSEYSTVHEGAAIMSVDEIPGGRFPNWQQLLPERPSKRDQFEVTVSPQLLKQVGDTLGAMGEKGHGITLTFHLGKVTGNQKTGRVTTHPILARKRGDTLDEGGMAIVMPITPPRD